MSLWEFNAAIKGYARIQSGKAPVMTEEEYEDGKAALRALNLPDMRI